MEIIRLAKIDKKLRWIDSDNQFVTEDLNGGIRTISETVRGRSIISKKKIHHLLACELRNSKNNVNSWNGSCLATRF